MNTAPLLLKGLRQAGCRITAQRRAICAHLAINQHPTPEGVYAALAGQQPSLSRATVYNTLNTLARLGLITPIAVGDQITHYEVNRAPHINLICQCCHQVIDLPAESLVPDIQQLIQRNSEFTAATFQIQVLGLCGRCHQRDTL